MTMGMTAMPMTPEPQPKKNLRAEVVVACARYISRNTTAPSICGGGDYYDVDPVPNAEHNSSA